MTPDGGQGLAAGFLGAGRCELLGGLSRSE